MRALVVGCGNMGRSHATAYHLSGDFELAGLVAPTAQRRGPLAAALGGVPEFDDFDAALAQTRPDVAAICSYPDSHASLVRQALAAGLHVFVEKPLAETVDQARELVVLAERAGRKLVVGYILRHHPAWAAFISRARSLGKPLVMRMNLNQQSSGREWDTHKKLMQSMSPIVDCGVHYVDVMCQMTQSPPVRVQAIGARLTDEVAPEMYNYGQLQVVFADGSVGWYESGWGPMMSETAYFVKDVVGPNGSVSIVEPDSAGTKGSDDINSHTRTSCLVVHHAETGDQGFVHADRLIASEDDPDHQELCNREQAYFHRAIREDLDLHNHLMDAINSLRIVLAADESIRSGNTVSLSS